MDKKKLLLMLSALAICFGSSFATVAIYRGFEKNTAYSYTGDTPVKFASMTNTQTGNTDFTVAAEKTVHSVVHVKTKYKVQSRMQDFGGFNDPFFDYFFGEPQKRGRQQAPEYEQQAAGSGVIISSDGYIVTNNHVVDKADNIEVTLNDKRTFTAKVVGTDPSTDIALIKIDANDLIPIVFGNSDNLKIGEWVLAIGNPFNLTSTVTAGIVSAKARGINILDDAMKIESFIQTDAAINPGNSGGALVNTAGELVGINTAIASQTGSYAGYAFAVPTTIVSKVVADLKEYGTVQRAVLGVQIVDIDDKLSKDKGLKTLNGAYVGGVQEKSAAESAGIKEGDVITAINNISVKSVAELQEQVARFRPGDKIQVTVNRSNKEQTFNLQLKNRSGNTNIEKGVDLSALGATFESLKGQIRGGNGVLVKSVSKNGLFGKAGIDKGFIILKINGQAVTSVEDIQKAYSDVINSDDSDKVMFISGVYQNGIMVHYIVQLK